MSLLIYLDRGVISSAAVSGAPATASSPGSGLQGDFRVGTSSTARCRRRSCWACCSLPRVQLVGEAQREPVPVDRGWAVDLGRATLACAAAPSYALFLARCAVGAGEASSALSRAVHRRRRAQSEENQVARGVLPVHPGRRRVGVHLRRVGRRELGWRWARDRERRHGARRRLRSACAPCLSTLRRKKTRSRRGGAAGKPDSDPSGFSGGAASSPRGERSGPRGGGAASLSPLSPPFGLRARRLDLARVPAYVTVLVGYVFYTAVVGVYAVWGPKAAFGVFGGPPRADSRGLEADFALGVGTVVAGVFGTLLGGFAVDHFARNTRRRRAFESPRASAPFRR